VDIPVPAYPAIGAIIAATIAGGISFLVAVLSKDHKTSEFRQAWIDGLRSDIVELVSEFLVITGMIRVMTNHGKALNEIFEHFAYKDEHFSKWEMANARIKLRLNPQEHQKLLAAVGALMTYAASEQLKDAKAGDALVDGLINESQVVLKRERKRVKSGEPVFIATKVVSLLIMVAAMSLCVAYLKGYWHE